GWLLAGACGATGCQSIVYETLDGGRSWTPLGFVGGPGYTQAHLVFTSPRDGFAYDPDLYATHDGGMSWRPVVQVAGTAPNEGIVTSLQATRDSVWILRALDCPQ